MVSMHSSPNYPLLGVACSSLPLLTGVFLTTRVFILSIPPIMDPSNNNVEQNSVQIKLASLISPPKCERTVFLSPKSKTESSEHSGPCATPTAFHSPCNMLGLNISPPPSNSPVYRRTRAKIAAKKFDPTHGSPCLENGSMEKFGDTSTTASHNTVELDSPSELARDVPLDLSPKKDTCSNMDSETPTLPPLSDSPLDLSPKKRVCTDVDSGVPPQLTTDELASNFANGGELKPLPFLHELLKPASQYKMGLPPTQESGLKSNDEFSPKMTPAKNQGTSRGVEVGSSPSTSGQKKPSPKPPRRKLQVKREKLKTPPRDRLQSPDVGVSGNTRLGLASPGTLALFPDAPEIIELQKQVIQMFNISPEMKLGPPPKQSFLRPSFASVVSRKSPRYGFDHSQSSQNSPNKNKQEGVRRCEFDHTISNQNSPKKVRPMNKPPQCKYCEKVLSSPFSLRQHLKEVHFPENRSSPSPPAKKKVLAPNTRATFPAPPGSLGRRYTCPRCRTKFSFLAGLQSHDCERLQAKPFQGSQEEIHLKKLACSSCGFIAKSRSGLQLHRKIYHKLLPQKPLSPPQAAPATKIRKGPLPLSPPSSAPHGGSHSASSGGPSPSNVTVDLSNTTPCPADTSVAALAPLVGLAPAPKSRVLITKLPASCPAASCRMGNSLNLVFPIEGCLTCTEPECDFISTGKAWTSLQQSCKRHLRVHHKINIETSYFWCKLCKEKINKHPSGHACLETSTPLLPPTLPHRLPCPECDQSFESSVGLQNHLLSHKRDDIRASGPAKVIAVPKRRRRRNQFQAAPDSGDEAIGLPAATGVTNNPLPTPPSTKEDEQRFLLRHIEVDLDALRETDPTEEGFLYFSSLTQQATAEVQSFLFKEPPRQRINGGTASLYQTSKIPRHASKCTEETAGRP